MFGQDGSGGLAVFWLVRTDEPLGRQPVVFRTEFPDFEEPVLSRCR